MTLEVEDLDDLPDHPNDRVVPGFEVEGHELVEEALLAANRNQPEQFYGALVVAETRVFVHGEDRGVAARSAADNVNDGDLDAVCIDRPVGPVDDVVLEVHDKWPSTLVENYYADDDEEWPVYQVHLLAAGRFYTWAGDPAEVSEVVPKIVDPGDFGHCAVATTWLADIDEVSIERLAIQRSELRRRLDGGEQADV